MELERQSLRQDSDFKSNGRVSPSWSVSDPDSHPITPQSSEMGLELANETIPSDHEGLVEEVKQLRSQLQIATSFAAHSNLSIGNDPSQRTA